MMLNKLSLNTIGLNRIGLNRIGKPSRASSDRPYIDPEVLASLKAVCICYGKSNDDPDRAVVKNLVDPDNPFIISNAAYAEGSGYADKDSPYYGAFVTDGVDDLITSTKTVQEMGITDEVTVVSMIHQIALNPTYNVGTTNYLENLDNGKHIRSDVYYAGKTGIYGYTASLINNTASDIKNILGDKADYSTQKNEPSQTLHNSKFSVVGRARNFTEPSSVAWYWTVIANKVLTTDQINQVIAYFNLDRCVEPTAWYDVQKQGLTNETPAADWYLKDFSKNGFNMSLFNFAKKGNSGVGKYEVDFTSWTKSHFTDGVNASSSKIEVTGILTTSSILINNNSTPIYKVDIYNPNKSVTVYFQYNNGTDITRISLVDGINELPSGDNSIFVTSDRLNSKGITITQIPSHAGALCFDGVDDFGINKDVPTFIDFTVIAKRTWLEENTSDKPFIIKGDSLYPDGNQNAFLFEYGKLSTYSFGQNNKYDESVAPSLISYATTYSYNGVVPLVRGSATDTIGIDVAHSTKIALYFLMLFPYSMSEFLIERQLKKHKLGTLYPDMVEFRPVIKANANYKITYYQIDSTNTWKSIKVGDYIVIGAKLAFQITFDNDASELKEVVSPQLSGIIVEKRPSNPGYNIYSYITSKSPQKINITIDEYIRYEDIVQPYPVLLRFNDENGNEVSWGGKFRVGSTITRIGGIDDTESNLLNGLYSISGLSLNGKAVTSSTSIVEKQMVFKTTATYLLDNNEPKCILSPSRLRIPNSSYKILGYIPDISGHGNHGVIHNSAYAEGSGVNEDGSYQFDGVDDFVTIPTLSHGGKQVLMKVNWSKNTFNEILYDQRENLDIHTFAIFNHDSDTVTGESVVAYNSKNNGNTYIDGILNYNIKASELKDIEHNITITNESVNTNNSISPTIGTNKNRDAHYAKMSLYDFMLFDDISTDDKIKELNKYVGIEGNVWGILTQLSNSTLISNETLIKNE